MTEETKPAKSQKKQNKFISSHGARKEAIARIRLYSGKGEIIVNGKPIDQYFPGKVAKIKWQRPFNLLNVQDKYYATIKVKGSGKNSQLDAVIHGLSRALNVANPDFRPTLKKAGLLTRDSRERQRRMVGMGGKSRRAKQSPKR